MIWIIFGISVIVLSLILALPSCIIFGAREGSFQYTERGEAYNGGREIPIWIDGGFGSADLIEIENAIGRWNYAMNGYIHLRVVDTHFDMEIGKIQEQIRRNGWLFMKIDSKTSYTPIVSGGYYSIGFADKVGGNHLYLIRDRLKNEEVFGVTLHEIGHLLGSGHVGDRLMSPHFSMAGNQCIDLATISAVAQWQGLPMNRLNYCYDAAIGDIKQMGEDAEVSRGRGDIIGLQDGFKKASFMDIGFLKEPPGEEGKGLLMGVISS